jgi:hypothetical protein
MKVIDQSLGHITVYDIDKGQIRKSLRYDALSKVMHSFAKHIHPSSQDRLVWLLDEQMFAFHRFDMSFTASEPCTIKHLKKIIDSKIEAVAQENFFDTPYVIHRLSHKYVNKTKTEYIL